MADDPTTTTELKAIQEERAEAHDADARRAETTAQERAARRRAEKAAYLRDRLAEAERAEQGS